MASGWHPADDVAARLWRRKLCFVRLHGTHGFAAGVYGRKEMVKLAARMKAFLEANQGCSAYAFFNNDAVPPAQPYSGCVRDAYALAESLSGVGSEAE